MCNAARQWLSRYLIDPMLDADLVDGMSGGLTDESFVHAAAIVSRFRSASALERLLGPQWEAMTAMMSPAELAGLESAFRREPSADPFGDFLEVVSPDWTWGWLHLRIPTRQARQGDHQAAGGR